MKQLKVHHESKKLNFKRFNREYLGKFQYQLLDNKPNNLSTK